MAKTTKKTKTKGLKTTGSTTGSTAKKATNAKKPRTKDSASNAKPRSAGRAVIAKFPADYGKLLTRRPPNNPQIPSSTIDQMLGMLSAIRDEMENYSAHLRALDRKRLNGVGIKKLGFIGRALELAAENPEFLPHWLDLQKFQDDNNNYLAVRSVFDIISALKEIMWNIVLQASDIIYTDALEYYSQVGDASKRRIDPTETLYNDLRTHFKRGSYKSEGASFGGAPTEKQLKRDFNALEKGTKDGRIEIENETPKTTGGKHKVIDETYKNSARFKDSEKGEVDE